MKLNTQILNKSLKPMVSYKEILSIKEKVHTVKQPQNLHGWNGHDILDQDCCWSLSI